MLEWEKIQGQILIHEMYILDTQDKNDPRETDRILLSHGKLSCFRAKGKAWTFSWTVRLDQQGDDSEDLAEIENCKLKEAEGASKRPSNRIPVIPLLYITADPQCTFWSTKVPVSRFLQIAHINWNSLWERWLPDFAWRPVQGGLCRNEDFDRGPSWDTAWQISWWSLSSINWDTHPGRAQAKQRWQPCHQGVFLESSLSGSSSARSSTSSSPGQVRIRVAPCTQYILLPRKTEADRLDLVRKITHATALVLQRPGFFGPSYHRVHNSNSHVAD